MPIRLFEKRSLAPFEQKTRSATQIPTSEWQPLSKQTSQRSSNQTNVRLLRPISQIFSLFHVQIRRLNFKCEINARCAFSYELIFSGADSFPRTKTITHFTSKLNSTLTYQAEEQEDTFYMCLNKNMQNNCWFKVRSIYLSFDVANVGLFEENSRTYAQKLKKKS